MAGGGEGQGPKPFRGKKRRGTSSSGNLLEFFFLCLLQLSYKFLASQTSSQMLIGSSDICVILLTSTLTNYGTRESREV